MGNIRVYKVNVFYGLEKESRSQTYWVTNEYNTPLAGSDILEYISEKTGMKKKERFDLEERVIIQWKGTSIKKGLNSGITTAKQQTGILCIGEIVNAVELDEDTYKELLRMYHNEPDEEKQFPEMVMSYCTSRN